MKLFEFDTETTGLDAKKHGIVQLAAIIKIDGEMVVQFELFARPDGLEIDDKALEVIGKTRKELNEYPPRPAFLQTLKDILGDYVDQYDKSDKFIPCAYNGWFDYQMLGEEFRRQDDKYFGSWFNHELNDPLLMINWIRRMGGFRDLESRKLVDVAAWLGIEVENAHNAMGDVIMMDQVIDAIDKMIATPSQHETRRRVMKPDEEVPADDPLSKLLRGEE